MVLTFYRFMRDWILARPGSCWLCGKRIAPDARECTDCAQTGDLPHCYRTEPMD